MISSHHAVCRGLPKRLASCKPANRLYTDQCTETDNRRQTGASSTAGTESDTMQHVIRHSMTYTGAGCHAGQCVLAMVKDN